MFQIELAGRALTTPILQGGMGVGVSMGQLAGHVAACGGMGTISTAGAGYNEPDFTKNPHEANLRALKKHVENAKELARGAGMVAVNAMVATTQYAESVRTAIQAGADAIVCGAGLALDLPALAESAGEKRVALAPIVSSAKAAKVICRSWQNRYQTLPDFIVVEGSKAGGHLGFSAEQVCSGTAPTLESIVEQVLQAVEPFMEGLGRKINVFAAGGVFTGEDIARFTKMGASGAQIATRFIATHECDASLDYKKVMLRAKGEDVTIIKSPVGMPGRAVRTPLVQGLELGNFARAKHCVNCLVPCKPAETPFCIAQALIEAVRGNYEKGLFFCGSNVGRVSKLVSVKDLMDTLTGEWKAACAFLG